jgi:hypothetical protein
VLGLWTEDQRIVTKDLFICNTRWIVKYVDGEVRSDDDDKTFGTCDKETLTIEISAKSPPEMQARTLLHETLHAIFASVCSEHPRVEEKCVTALETGLYSILRDKRNEWWVDTIMSGKGWTKETTDLMVSR